MPRQRLQAFAALETQGRHPNDQAFSAVTDVSRAGVGLKTGQPPLRGQRVILRLAIEEDIHTITAVATRIRKRDQHVYDVGLDWSSCSDEELEFLDSYLAATTTVGAEEPSPVPDAAANEPGAPRADDDAD
ncbi:MAG: PilZ domain-containing protein [Planctomycetota bacterium]